MLLAFLIALAPSLALAAVPAEGVQLKVRRGLFTETDIGAMMTFGGRDKYSNAQTFLQLGIGYDLSEHVELAVQFGLGSSAANCFAEREAGRCNLADSFTMAFGNLTVTYLLRLAERLYLTPKLTAGYASLDPAPVVSSDGRPITSGANLGGGLGIEYATQMDHFSIGADVVARFIVRASITTLAIFPRVKYTF
jgi:hypothetical protein